MKKIVLILFLFFLCLSCYFIYNKTKTEKITVMSLGDSIANNPNFQKNTKINYLATFTNKDYRLIDVINILKFNQEVNINNKNISIYQELHKANILLISIGMNDLYYKLNDDTKEIYTYLNNIVNNYEELLSIISKYNYQKVYILGYYNIYNNNNDLFTYLNYKINKLANKYNYTFIDLNNILYKNQEYFQKNNDYYLNNNGFQKIYEIIMDNYKKNWYNT